MSGILKALNAAKKDLTTVKHPLHEAELSEKLHYCTGVAMVAGVDETINDQERQFLSDLVFSLDLPEDYAAKVIEGIGAVDDTMVKSIVVLLQEKGWRDYFIFDLYRMARCDKELSEQENEVVAYFGEMLGIPRGVEELYQKFLDSASNHKEEVAKETYQKILNHKIEISMQLCQFLFPGFEYAEEIIGYEMKNGEVRIIERNCVIKDTNLVVNPGCKLVVKGVKVTLANSMIEVNGGKIEIDKCYFIADEGCEQILSLKDITGYTITNSVFDGNRHSGGVYYYFNQNGTIQFDKCKFVNMNSENSAIKTEHVFLGDKKNTLILDNCTFDDCVSVSGGAINCGDFLEMNNCVFSNCEAYNVGGAINIFRDDELKMNDCRFKNCKAGTDGGAIFFSCWDPEKVKKLSLKNIFENCSPNNTD